MLRSLAAQDFAIIERADLALAPGMTALTGETGAGKSLMVDALMLLSGARADSGAIRHGAERAELAAEFDVSALPDVRRWLADLELDEGNDCRIRRVLRADGSSRAFVNDRAVSAATLRGLVEQLVEIHGQHEHQALLSRARQLALLDAYADHPALLEKTAAAARDWARLDRELETLRGKVGQGGQALEFLRFQLDELERHALEPAALAEIEAEHRRLAHRGELLDGAARARDAVDGDHDSAVRAVLARLTIELDRLVGHDPAITPIASLIRDASVQIDEAADALERYCATAELDPERLDALDQQLAKLHELARKHRLAPTELKTREAELRAEYDELAHAEQRLADLARDRDAALSRYREAAVKLSAARAKAATRLGKRVSEIMGELGMSGGRLNIALDTEADAAPRPEGADAVEFMVSANPGQPERALRKVASGGELSRISLAIEVATLGRGDVPTMVFDEVDTGIGGAVAEVVGRKLRELGSSRQVLCVTHLPQVAAQAHHQFAVSKSVQRGQTRTAWQALDTDTRTDELARMLGGVEITAETRAHARDLLKRAQGA